MLENHPPKGDDLAITVFPNPFSKDFTVTFSLSKAENVTLTLYDTTGNAVDWISMKNHPAGTFKYQFNPTSLTTGVYLLNVETNTFSKSIPITFVK